MNISIPDALAQQLQSRVDASKEFHTIEEYVHYVLTAVIQQTVTPSTSTNAYSENQQKEVRERLENLGYLD